MLRIEDDETASIGDMSDDEFQEALTLVGQWVARYRREVHKLPVQSRVKPGDVRRALPAEPPERGEPVEAWLKDLDEVILPAVTHWNHPGFLAYFGLTGSAPGLFGEMVAATLNVNGMLWKTSPACTELEQTVMQWYATAMGLPADWFGFVTDTASTSSLVALGAAREKAYPGTRDEGISGKPPLVVYCSEEAHSSIDKAAWVLGLGSRGVRRIPSDGEYRMRSDLLQQAIADDRAAGRVPMAVVATVGTTSVTAVDPVPRIAEICREQDLWLHVDAAYAGTAAIAPEFRWVLEGCEQADSLVSNPHKWLFTPIDISAFYTRHPDHFRAAYSLVPEYLRSQVQDTVDLMDYSFQLGRRFRALKLWFVFRHFGTQGIAARLRRHVALAQEFARRVDAHPGLERLAPSPFSVVCFRVHPPGLDDEARLERLNSALLNRINESGEAFLSHTKLKGRYSLRIAVGNLRTTWHYLERVLAFAEAAAAEH
jgi:aromatic-L-amino-acid/L-tryptophan decarboxylase